MGPNANYPMFLEDLPACKVLYSISVVKCKLSHHVGVNPLSCGGQDAVHSTYVAQKPLSGFPTIGYAWTRF